MRNGNRGFTLVELLVVIAIISVLAGLLLPALEEAKSQAHFVECLSNQRQTYLVLTTYADDYGEWPTNETPTYNWHYYRYATRGGNGVMWLVQAAGTAFWQDLVYGCPAGLPGNGDLTGAIPRDYINWTWAARDKRSYAAEMWDQNEVENDRRSWFAYHGPLRDYPSAMNGNQVTNNAWDWWGAGWRWNNSLSARDPINNPQGNCHVPLRNTKPRVMVYCPNAVRTCAASGSPWWHEWRAPHGRKPWNGDSATLEPVLDARNYLFNDGHAVSIQRY